jgi:hypothetical protein
MGSTRSSTSVPTVAATITVSPNPSYGIGFNEDMINFINFGTFYTLYES